MTTERKFKVELPSVAIIIIDYVPVITIIIIVDTRASVARKFIFLLFITAVTIVTIVMIFYSEPDERALSRVRVRFVVVGKI